MSARSTDGTATKSTMAPSKKNGAAIKVIEFYHFVARFS